MVHNDSIWVWDWVFFATLWANSAVNNLMVFLSYFSEKIGFVTCFLGKNGNIFQYVVC